MPWVADKYNALTWQEPVNDDTIVTLSVGELTSAIADALSVVRVVPQQEFNVGDKILISATVTGQKQRHVNFVLDGVPEDMIRSFTMPASALAIASQPAPYVAPGSDAA